VEGALEERFQRNRTVFPFLRFCFPVIFLCFARDPKEALNLIKFAMRSVNIYNTN
jgi:hypothetical protein